MPLGILPAIADLAPDMDQGVAISLPAIEAGNAEAYLSWCWLAQCHCA